MKRYHNRLLSLLLAPAIALAGCSRSADEAAQAEAPTNVDGKKASTQAAVSASPEATGEAGVPGRYDEAESDDPDDGRASKPSAATPPHQGRPKIIGKTGGGYLAPPPGPVGLIAPAPAPPHEESPNVIVPEGGGASIAEMYFQHYGVNPTIDTAEQALSTFSVDVDTTSYTVTRSYLSRGQLPPEASVRVEEFINSFDYGYEPPEDAVFSVHAEAAPSPNREGYHLLHIGLKGKEIAKEARKAANLVFVIDVSGSMDMDNRLGLVKRSLHLLVDQLEEKDKVAIVTYGSEARQVLPPTSAFSKERILSAIDGLTTEGATNAEAGLRLGYKIAAQNLREGGINRVVLCSDGVANSGLTTAGGLLDTIKSERERGITISTVGFGMGNYNDVLMEKLAQGGNGNYHYVDRLDQARKVFVENLTGTLQVIAKDVKLQVAFDPKVVSRYRLLGYENRQLEAKDFNNDRVDAGEVGAGHAVTAIYEVKLREGATAALGKVRVRFKAPEGSTSRLVEKPLARSIMKSSIHEVASPTQLSFLAAGFAEKMRGSYWARNIAYEDVLGRFNDIVPPLRQHKDVVELRRLIEKAQGLDSRDDKFEQNMPVAKMDFDRVPVLQ